VSRAKDGVDFCEDRTLHVNYPAFSSSGESCSADRHLLGEATRFSTSKIVFVDCEYSPDGAGGHIMMCGIFLRLGDQCWGSLLSIGVYRCNIMKQMSPSFLMLHLREHLA
jgi:hypothetical protein